MRTLKLCLFLLFASCNFILISQDGTVDQSFGEEGKLQIDVNNTQDYLNDLGVLSDGRMIGVGKSQEGEKDIYAIICVEESGNLDTDFGNGGMIIGLGASAENSEAVGVTVYNDDIYVQVGSYNDTASYFQIFKFDGNGDIVTSFADNGVFDFVMEPGNWAPNDIYADKNGNIYASGERGRLICLIKLDENGAKDETFGNAGVMVLDQGNNFERAIGLSTQADGKILMTGELNDPMSDWNLNVFRVEATGVLDNSFSDDGYIIENISTGNTETGKDIIQLIDGNILAAGGAHNGNNHQALFIKYMSNGVRNTAFGDNGLSLIETGTNSPMEAIAIDDMDRIVAAGNDVLMRLTMDGNLDTSFGDNGLIKDNLYFLTGMILDKVGDIIIAGSYWNGENNDFLMQKFKSGSTTSALDSSKDYLRSINIFPNPFQDQIIVEFSIVKSSDVHLTIYDASGRKVALVKNQNLAPGQHRYELKLEDFSNHFYFLKLTTDKYVYTRKIVKN